MSLPKIACLTFFLFGILNFAANAELVGYCSFDKADGVDDLTGNGHDGNIHGNPKVVAGKFGEALEFNGSTVRTILVVPLTKWHSGMRRSQLRTLWTHFL